MQRALTRTKPHENAVHLASIRQVTEHPARPVVAICLVAQRLIATLGLPLVRKIIADNLEDLIPLSELGSTVSVE